MLSIVWYFLYLPKTNKICGSLTILHHHLHFFFLFGLPHLLNTRDLVYLFTWTCADFTILWICLILWILFSVTIYMDSVLDALHEWLDLHWDNQNNLKTRSPKVLVVSISAKQIYRSALLISYPSFLIC